MQKQYFAATLAQVTGCSAITLRAWRNRNGLFPNTKHKGGWNRFSLADILAVRLIVMFTGIGLSAQTAVDAAMIAIPLLEEDLAQKKLPAGLVFSVDEDKSVSIERVADFELDGLIAFTVDCGLAITVNFSKLVQPILDRMNEIDIPVADENGNVRKVVLGAKTRTKAERAAIERIKLSPKKRPRLTRRNSR